MSLEELCFPLDLLALIVTRGILLILPLTHPLEPSGLLMQYFRSPPLETLKSAQRGEFVLRELGEVSLVAIV